MGLFNGEIVNFKSVFGGLKELIGGFEGEIVAFK
jgi:hypothetical protein